MDKYVFVNTLCFKLSHHQIKVKSLKLRKSLETML